MAQMASDPHTALIEAIGRFKASKGHPPNPEVVQHLDSLSQHLSSLTPGKAGSPSPGQRAATATAQVAAKASSDEHESAAEDRGETPAQEKAEGATQNPTNTEKSTTLPQGSNHPVAITQQAKSVGAPSNPGAPTSNNSAPSPKTLAEARTAAKARIQATKKATKK